MRSGPITAGVAFVATALAPAAPAFAQNQVPGDPAADFFRDRPVTFIVSYGPGGSYGLYAQVAARHMPKHLPGRPTITVQFMPGAGGITAANHLYNLAPKDGTTIATVTKDLALEQALRPNDVRFDARKFGWIGTFSEYVAVFAVWTASGIGSIEDTKKRDTIMATSGRSHQGSQLAVLFNEYVGSRFKLVAGYRGAADMNVAMERGEAHARITSWSGLKSQHGEWVTSGKVAAIAQGGSRKQPDLPGVPLFTDLITDPVGQKLLALVESGAVVGWPVLLPPGVPTERLAAWRKAFDATMKDPEFIAEITKSKLDVEPKSGAEIEQAMAKALSVDEKVLARARVIADITN